MLNCEYTGWEHDNRGKVAMISSRIEVPKDQYIPSSIRPFAKESEECYQIEGYVLGKVVDEEYQSMTIHFGWSAKDMEINADNVIQILPDDMYLDPTEQTIPCLEELMRARR